MHKDEGNYVIFCCRHSEAEVMVLLLSYSLPKSLGKTPRKIQNTSFLQLNIMSGNKTARMNLKNISMARKVQKGEACYGFAMSCKNKSPPYNGGRGGRKRLWNSMSLSIACMLRFTIFMILENSSYEHKHIKIVYQVRLRLTLKFHIHSKLLRTKLFIFNLGLSTI